MADVKVGKSYRFSTAGRALGNFKQTKLCAGRVLERLPNGLLRVELAEAIAAPPINGEPGDIVRVDEAHSAAEPL